MAKGKGEEIKKAAGWGAIIAALVFFFPAGIVMAGVKLSREKDNYSSNAKGNRIIGYVFIGLGIFYFIMCLTGQTTEPATFGQALTGLLIFAAIGSYPCYAGFKYGKIGQIYDKYMPLINESVDGSLDDIAAATGKNYDEVVSDIDVLIKAGCLKDIRIDTTNRVFTSDIMNMKKTAAAKKKIMATESEIISRKEKGLLNYKTIKCPNCGATNNVVYGEENVCEFCGSPLENIDWSK